MARLLVPMTVFSGVKHHLDTKMFWRTIKNQYPQLPTVEIKWIPFQKRTIPSVVLEHLEKNKT